MTDRAKRLGNESIHNVMDFDAGKYASKGLTKREYFAAKIMAKLAYDDEFFDVRLAAHISTQYADALLEELSKTDKTE